MFINESNIPNITEMSESELKDTYCAKNSEVKELFWDKASINFL